MTAGDLVLAPVARAHGLGDRGHVAGEEVEPGDGEVRPWRRRLLDDGRGPAVGVELDHAVPLRIGDVVAEHAGAPGGDRGPEPLAEVGAEEDVVAEHERHRLAADERLADDERLGEALGLRLLGVLEPASPLGPVTEETLEPGQVLGRGDDEDLPDPGRDQRRERVVDHRLVVHRQELLADDGGHRREARARAPGEHDSSHSSSSFDLAAAYRRDRSRPGPSRSAPTTASGCGRGAAGTAVARRSPGAASRPRSGRSRRRARRRSSSRARGAAPSSRRRSRSSSTFSTTVGDSGGTSTVRMSSWALGLGHLAVAEQVLVELLARPQAGEHDRELGRAARRELAGDVVDPHRVAHVEHERVAVAGRSRRPG